MSKIVEIAVRVYTKKKDKEKPKKSSKDEGWDNNRVLVFDTETTTDQFQNLTFGSFKIYNNGILEHQGIFYNPDTLSKEQFLILKHFCQNKDIPLYTSQEFIDKVFYPEILINKTLCISYNLPFDISRVIIKCSYARGRLNKGFSLKLSNNKAFPRVRVRHLDSTKSFIEFGRSFYNEEGHFKGFFVDVKTLVFALTNENLTLAEAVKYSNLEKRKLTREKHGIITEDYIRYNLNDVDITYLLFLKLVEEIKKFSINIPITKIYSSASIGKAFLEELGIKPFLEQNPDFSPKILGNLMSAFYGGRCELRIRKKPILVTILDFFSNYPTLFTSMGLWDYLIADKIEYYEDTDNVQKLLDNIELGDLQNMEIWKELNVLVEIYPEKDILPIRARFDKKSNVYNIAVNEVSSEKPLFYALPDIIASKFISGKTPKIKKAIRFKAIGKQKSLKEFEIFGLKNNPKEENLIKLLAEKRYELKHQEDSNNTQRTLKFLLNSITYGIFIEMNEQDIADELEVYSDIQYKVTDKFYEKEGKHYNPIISVMIVSGARLLLSIAEGLLRKYRTFPAYCDTDSIAVPVHLGKIIEEFFNVLNPYSFKTSIFKVQKKKTWFYGICSKRYVLYDKEGDKITINDYKLHGLGHLKAPFENNKEWHKTVWEDVLKLNYGLITFEKIMQKYSSSYAISQLAISNYDILKRFKNMNKNKAIKEQIKPFNFMLVGISNNKEVKPIAPYSRRTQKAVYEEFINYITGEKMIGEEYWKQLHDIFSEFINKSESKFDGDIGELKRKHIIVDNITHIGKEAKNIEFVGTLKKAEYEIYENNEKLTQILLSMSVSEARKIRISKTTLHCIKKRILEGKTIKLRKKTLEKLKNYIRK